MLRCLTNVLAPAPTGTLSSPPSSPLLCPTAAAVVSDKGDSGAIVLDRGGRAVAVINGGGGMTDATDVTFAIAYHELQPAG